MAVTECPAWEQEAGTFGGVWGEPSEVQSRAHFLGNDTASGSSEDQSVGSGSLPGSSEASLHPGALLCHRHVRSLPLWLQI